MLHRTRGIVLRQTRFSESSLVIRMYTEHFGLQSYMANGVRSAKTRGRGVMLQPPNVLDLEVYHKEGRSMHRIREMSPHVIYTKIPFEIPRSSTALFITEVLNKSLKEEHAEPVLFEFLVNALKVLDSTPGGLAAFPIVFLLEFSRYLGFRPEGRSTQKHPLFDLQDGIFTAERPGHGLFLFEEECTALNLSLDRILTSSSKYEVSPMNRKNLLDKLLMYYRLHVDGFGELKSPAVLKLVMAKE